MRIKYLISINLKLTILSLFMSLAVLAGSDTGKKIDSNNVGKITAEVSGDSRWIWYPGDFECSDELLNKIYILM